MKNPLDLEPGDIIYVDLTSPLRYSDGKGGEELRWFLRLQVDQISRLGIAAMGAENDVSIVPSPSRESQKIGGERIEFFPWSSILRVALLHKYEEYQRIWDSADE